VSGWDAAALVTLMFAGVGLGVWIVILWAKFSVWVTDGDERKGAIVYFAPLLVLVWVCLWAVLRSV
jgi:hypothetical protein